MSRLNLFFQKNVLEVGIDEAGLGPLFGRCYAAAVIWNPDLELIWENTPRLKYISSMIDKIKDSKKIKASQRHEIAEFIKNYAIDYQIIFSDERTIEEINIRNANFKNMHKALDNLKIKAQHIIVDGNSFPEYYYPSDTSSQIPHTCIVKGDNKYISIAAASILAKTSRDDYILDLVKQYPDLEKYGLKNNFGYATPKHIKAIKTYGPSQYHRKTFGICKIPQ